MQRVLNCNSTGCGSPGTPRQQSCAQREQRPRRATRGSGATVRAEAGLDCKRTHLLTAFARCLKRVPFDLQCPKCLLWHLAACRFKWQ